MDSISLLQAICKTAKGKLSATMFAEAIAKNLPNFGINTKLRVAAFISQTMHESAEFTRLTENLNYTSEQLAATWPSRYRNADGTPNALAKSLNRTPEAIANNIYASRLGNGDQSSGDGWKYRGRGLIQLTGHENYSLCGKAIGLDLVNNPDLLLTPDGAVKSACWFWSTHGLNTFADTADVVGMTKRINGGTNGLVEREDYFRAAMAAIKSETGIVFGD